MKLGSVDSAKHFVLHRGVSFCDASLIDSQGEVLQTTRWLYSKHRFKSQIETWLAPFNGQIQSVTLLDEFADRLSGLRLGGSVAAVFPKGLEKLTSHLQSSPIHSETVVFASPSEWSPDWLEKTRDVLKQHSIKRIAWQCETPSEVLDFFQAQGYENFLTETSNESPVLNWRRNLLNASCSGPILELTEEVQLALKNVGYEGPLSWLDEDLQLKEKTLNRYGLTSSWTHLVARWAEAKLGQACDVFVLDWDGCFHIGQPSNVRWTPWGPVSLPRAVPNVQLFSVQPTQTLEKDAFGDWHWLGRADNFEPGPVFLGRGLKPTVLDLVLTPDLMASQFQIKADAHEKINRQVASLLGLRTPDQIQREKETLKRSVLQSWALEALQLSQTKTWLFLGPLAEMIQSDLRDLSQRQISFQVELPTLPELFDWTRRL
ncbi:MAG: hypothetical protein ACK5Y2_08875 [Bdellovibrionales bacterium]